MKKLKIMIVEDEIILAANLRQKFINSGYDVCELVDTGNDAIRNVKEEMPDLILMKDGATVLDLAKEIVELTKSKSKIVFRELPQDDPKVRQPDISKAKKMLNWTPTIAIQDGLKRTIEYFKKLHAGTI